MNHRRNSLCLALALLSISGCATLGKTVQTVGKDLGEFQAGLAQVCPQERQTAVCKLARDGYVATEASYQLAVLAEYIGTDATQHVNAAVMAMRDAWELLKGLVKGTVKDRPLELVSKEPPAVSFEVFLKPHDGD